MQYESYWSISVNKIFTLLVFPRPFELYHNYINRIEGKYLYPTLLDVMSFLLIIFIMLIRHNYNKFAYKLQLTHYHWKQYYLRENSYSK